LALGASFALLFVPNCISSIVFYVYSLHKKPYISQDSIEEHKKVNKMRGKRPTLPLLRQVQCKKRLETWLQKNLTLKHY
jgi:hypothetical protein